MGVAPSRADRGENSEEVENVCADDLSDVCSRVERMEREGVEDMPELICQDGWADADQLEDSPCFSSLGRDVTPETTPLRGSQNLLDAFTTSRFDSDRRQSSLRRLRRLVDYSDSESEEEGHEDDLQDGGGGQTPPPRPLTDYYTLTKGENVYVKKFKIRGRTYEAMLNHNNLDQLNDLQAVMTDIIRNALEDIYTDGHPTDEIGVTFEHPGLRKGRFDVPFQPRAQLTPERIFKILESLLGYDEIDLDSSFRLKMTRIAQTRGGVRDAKKHWKHRDFIKKHTGPHGGCFIQINNSGDELCFPRAVVTAIAWREFQANRSNKELARKWGTIRKGDKNRCTLQKRLAEELAGQAGLAGHQEAYGEREFRKIQDVLDTSGYQIKIFSSRCFNFIVFQGRNPPESDDKVLHIYHDFSRNEEGGHFYVCTKPHTLFRKQMWCDKCNKGFNEKLRHKCIEKCNCCYSLEKCAFVEWKECNDCNRRFRSEECFEKHKSVAQPKGENKKKRVNKSICQKFKRCTKCNRLLNHTNSKPVPGKEGREGKILHNCNHYYCHNCKDFHPNGAYNECYMQPIFDKKKKGEEEAEAMEVDSNLQNKENQPPTYLEEEDEEEENSRRYRQIDELVELLGDNDPEEEETEVEDRGTKIFFDFESSQVKVIGDNQLGPILEHVPNYCNVQKVCMNCQEDALNGTWGNCVFCGDGEFIFEGADTKEKFCKWLFDDTNQGARVIAHNSKGYDSQFLIQYLVKEAMIPKVIMKGTEFMMIEINKIRIIDSLNFFPMGLSELPKAFNLKELRKGYFPHKFNTPENLDYVGVIPDAWFYDAGNMKGKKREEFYEWYNAEKERVGENFNFHEELAAYCRSDVDILMRSCLRFEKDLIKLVDMRPFDVAITIASFCMKLFRKKFLKERSIGLIPHMGYRGRENQSVKALRWLKWLSEEEDIQIQHAGNGREKKILDYKVDGFHAPTNTVYEFNGCIWHGCTCKKNRAQRVPNSTLTLEDAYQAWITRRNNLESLGYRVVCTWECEYEKELDENPRMRAFTQSVDLLEPLKVSEALRGGRTNANRLYYKCKPGEEMHYVDVVSLYPWGVKWTEFPVGHPEIITENFAPITNDELPYFGIIKCQVLAPKKLLHPILPYKCGGKLMFPLCRSCAQTQHQGFCTHSDAERSFTGEFVSTELNMALKRGYQVLKMYEVWHYKNTAKHDGINEETGLFTKYINFFLKLKIEASGWPGWVKSESDKLKFLAECERREGIKLDPSKIEKNPGMRQIAKLCLNSFWGKFGQRSNMNKDEFVSEPSKFSDILFDERNIVENVRIVNEEILLVSYRHEDEFVDLMPHMNKVIAAFTTANCRLRLYEELEKLGDRVCYFDTDSIIYIKRNDSDYCPKLGSFLGDMTDELEKYGPGAYIEEFISGGPKNYGFKVHVPNGKSKTEVKIRGFTLSHAAAQHLNFETLKRKVFEFVKGEKGSVTTIVQPQIARTSDRRVVTKDVAKKYGIVYDKRWVKSDFSTLPYGTCNV